MDDFERGIFSVSSAIAAQHVIPIAGYSGHAMAASRKIVLNAADPLFPVLMSNTHTTPFPDQVLTVVAQAGGSATLTWEWGGARDLTALGSVERVEIEFGQSTPGGQIKALLTDGGGQAELTLPTSGGLEVISFDLSDFVGADPTQALSLGFRFGPGEVPYKISEIRFRQAGSLDVDFVGNLEATTVPPLPSSPLRFTAWNDPGGPGPASLYVADLVFQDATAAGPVEVNASWEEQGGVTGSRGVVDVHWDESGVFLDTSFRMSIDLAPGDGVTPLFYPPDPIQDDPTSFALSIPVMLFDGSVPVGTANTLVLFDVNGGQGAEFPSVSILPHPSASSTITGFDVVFDYVATTGVEVGDPLFRVTWIADWQPAATSAVPERPTTGPFLTAWPSVTRGGTELRAARPFTAGARVAVHDVRGRRLRSLLPAPGSDVVNWDGRDDAGRALPSGVYYVRLADRWGRAVARVTRLP